jgi:site-specific recombinase XerC
LCRLLGLLRAAGVAPPAKPIQRTAAQRLADDYRRYLAEERGVDGATIYNYARHIDRFLSERFGAGSVALSQLQARDITQFVKRHARRHGGGYALQMVTAL